jgi:cytoskeletal protein CcmA (bactofilin family)
MDVIGKAVRIRGKVRGAEDLVLKGQIEGTIQLPKNHLMIETGALMAGDVEVQKVTVRGELAGNGNATDRVQLDPTAKMLGDVHAPILVVADGAKLKGRVDMTFELPAELNLKYRK